MSRWYATASISFFLTSSSMSFDAVISRVIPKVPIVSPLGFLRGSLEVSAHDTLPSVNTSFSTSPIIGESVRIMFCSSS